jgi:hypothetical protein
LADPGPSPFRYHLELTPAQLKETHDALRAHAAAADSSPRTRRLVDEVLAMLPGEEHIALIRPDDDGDAEPGPGASEREGGGDEVPVGGEGPDPPDLLA